MSRIAIDMAGWRRGKLRVVRQAKNIGWHAAWLCLCDCGTEIVRKGSHLRHDGVRSCGCWDHLRTHGGSKTSLYKAWTAMRARCENPNTPGYHRYGGRGIKVCARWKNFATFRDDVGERPPGRQLDRINNDGDYKPSNCRWATPKDNIRNSAVVRLVTHAGKTMCLSAWSEETGINRATLNYRRRNGWSVERMLTEPVR